MTDLTKKQTAEMPKKNAGGVGETIKTLVYAMLIAFGVRTFAFEPFNIPSGSMIPTLLVGDYLFVSKFSYGYSRHTIGFGLPLFEGRIFGDQPERGDVVVFKLPRDNSTDYIKRVVGLPGDTVQVVNGILHINGEAVKRDRIEDFVATNAYGQEIRSAQFVETLPNGTQHRILEESDNAPLDNTPRFAVPPGHYFLMGDNRDNSLDSRVPGQVGFVPEENLVGRAEFLFFSLEEGASVWQIWKWPTAIRFSRVFDGIE